MLYRIDAGVGGSEDSASAVRVGHIVLALGAGPRASWGVVSSLGEGRMLHLDLTLYPGFSGGPLVDAQGRVVGINTSGASRHWQLAIPAAAVNRVVDELQRRGRIPRAYLGVSTQPVRLPEPVRQRLNLDQQTAVIVVEVQSGSPAAAAGLQPNDVIVKFGGTAVDDYHHLQRLSSDAEPGTTVPLDIVRKRDRKTVTLKIAESPDTTPPPAPAPAPSR